MVALSTACLCFEILVHALNCISQKARAKTVSATLNNAMFNLIVSVVSSDTLTLWVNKLEVLNEKYYFKRKC